MLINQTYFIDSCDDVELNIKRESKLEYRITYDDSKQMEAIVFIIGGFGANANISFLDFDREYLAKKFNIIVVNVFYHCFSARPSIDEKYNPIFMPNEKDWESFCEIAKICDMEIYDHEKSNFKNCIRKLDERSKQIKHEGRLKKDFLINLSCDFVLPNNEYQNYGIMAAIDHINALKDIMKNYPQFKSLPKIYGGGSYGGYLALMCAKIAPWYVDGVIDNSGVTLPHLPHLLGRESECGEFAIRGDNYILLCFVKKYWTRDESSPYFLSNDNYMIRVLLNSKHLSLQNEKNQNTIFISYHSAKDEGAPVEHKSNFYEFCKQLGFDATLHIVKDENDVDGRYIKSLEHGLRMTDRALFKKELPILLEKLKNKTFNMRENSISYPCKDKIFTFKDFKDRFELKITRL
ncbi:TPA: DUF2920 family protein [Campylobacter lari]|uniref:DUF2920 family protein n=1 Tax=Campylobacter sp. IFREMER_LSEM_CL1890 TaxID=2911615 RepID=UPI0014187450|nr:DUF2920 family protein [Campylobacter sp. IFREMER_LSEM_CL1890]EDP6879480.1 DUF2920 family protein [Campylobacter lari]MCV3409919.1 DUF2920 family protein [Campylobacter sp. IFREMER_LSEM_CL1890]HEC1798038.1 DUF2920 family protein [Campylobacter lari]